ncbi:unnamed protein product, partial [Rotaria sp. Silwood1]
MFKNTSLSANISSNSPKTKICRLIIIDILNPKLTFPTKSQLSNLKAILDFNPFIIDLIE